MIINSSSPAATKRIGQKIAKKLNGGEIIALTGDLGAGKTVLVKGIARGLRVKTEVVSPTFSILNVYDSTPALYHFDFYRLHGADDAYDRGLTEYFNAKNTVCVLEWPERISDLLKEYKTIDIKITRKDSKTRQIEILGDFAL